MKLRIEKPIYGGAGLGRHEGKAVFVPFTIPGEIVEAHAVSEARSFTDAELDSVDEASPSRSKPPCPYFGECGGCHYQHAVYAAQVEMKIAVLRESLERAHIADIPEISALTGDPLGYRNRIRLHVQPNPFSLCYKYRNSHRNLPVETCPIAAPLLQETMAVLHREGAALGLGFAEEAELFAGPKGDAMLLSLWTSGGAREAERALGALWPRLQQLLPALAGTVVFSAAKPSGKAHRAAQILARAGENSLHYVAGQYRYRVSTGSFFQVNRFLIEPLVQLVTGVAAGQTSWDLYAGVGLFSLPLAQKFAEVTAVESSAAAVHDLRENLRGTKHRVVAADTATFLERAVQQRLPAPDLVVVDPPRAGLGRNVTTALGQLRPRNITYVSCDPATLSRDLAALLESGYRLQNMRLVDLFPQTFHLESVTHLTLK